MRGQLQQELSLKQEAFQQVDRLQHRVNHMEAATSTSTTGTPPPLPPLWVQASSSIYRLSRHLTPRFLGFCSITGQSRSCYTLPVSSLSSGGPSAGTAPASTSSRGIICRSCGSGVKQKPSCHRRASNKVLGAHFVSGGSEARCLCLTQVLSGPACSRAASQSTTHQLRSRDAREPRQPGAVGSQQWTDPEQ